MKRILVLCTGNSCRSQIAEGYLRHFANNKAEIYSAGIETHGVNPKAIEIMEEDNIDISKHTSNNIDEYADINFDYIITVCDSAKENCPFFPSPALDSRGWMVLYYFRHYQQHYSWRQMDDSRSIYPDRISVQQAHSPQRDHSR